MQKDNKSNEKEQNQTEKTAQARNLFRYFWICPKQLISQFLEVPKLHLTNGTVEKQSHLCGHSSRRIN